MSELEQNSMIPLATMPFDNDHCFLCGALLTEANRTVEHVYPKWLQTKFNLWNQHLILLNQTSIPYKNLVIPCCKRCNSHMNKTIETPLMEAAEAGYDAFVELDKQKIFQWLCKLSYGILFKEMFLKLDRSKHTSGTILNKEDLKEEQTTLLFLQSMLTNANYEGHKPYSIMIFRLHGYEDDPYWASDNPIVHTFFMRIGNIGIIANLMDNGVNEEIFMGDPQMRSLTKQTLHPIQFAEICAKFFYKSYLLSVTQSNVFLLNELGIPEMVLGISSSICEERDWSQEYYAKILAYYLTPWRIDFEMLYREGGLVRTFLWNDNGEFVENFELFDK